MGFPGGSDSKESRNAGDLGSVPGLDKPRVGPGLVPWRTACIIAWTEEPGGP